eukprot:tig00000525_g1948.t1
MSSAGPASANLAPAVFGLPRWESERRLWKSGSAARQGSSKKRRERYIDIDLLEENVYGTSALPAPIPLADLVAALVKAWEAEGLFD